LQKLYGMARKPLVPASSPPQGQAPPDVPGIDEPLKWCVYHGTKDWPILKKAPLAVTAIVLGVLIVSVTATALVYEKFIIVNKEGIIALQAQKIEGMKEKLGDGPNKSHFAHKLGDFSPEARERMIAKFRLAYTSDIKIRVASKINDERSTRLLDAIVRLIDDAGYPTTKLGAGTGIDVNHIFTGIIIVSKKRLSTQLEAAFDQLYKELGESNTQYMVDESLGEPNVIIQIGL
jgi:hypothetical protein